MSTTVKPDQILVNKHGKPKAVVLSFINYRKLLRLIEDAQDAKLLTRAVRTSRHTLTYEQFLKRLKRKRLI